MLTKSNFMKSSLLASILLVLLTSISVVSGEIHHGWLERYRNMIAEAKKNPREENVLMVVDELRLCYRYMNQQDETNVAMYLELKKGALELPDHLKFITNKIEAERAKVVNHAYHSGTRNSFNSLRVEIIRDTLCHLPSPATVKVLGNYLSDERDTPPPRHPGQDWIDSESNAYQACTALEQIGLRNAPVPPRSAQNESNLATWRLWWGQVEAGTRAFSFEGEDVEYRFRKDGTWETTALGSKTATSARDLTTTAENKSPTSARSRWFYVVLGVLLGISWLRWKKFRTT